MRIGEPVVRRDRRQFIPSRSRFARIHGDLARA
jgi:hypothetical protein